MRPKGSVQPDDFEQTKGESKGELRWVTQGLQKACAAYDKQGKILSVRHLEGSIWTDL